MAYRIKLAPQVQKDVDEVVGYIAKDSVRAALSWHEGLLQRISSLKNMPQRCARASEDFELRLGLRQLVYGNYRILLIIDDGLQEVRILRVRHAARGAIDPQSLGSSD